MLKLIGFVFALLAVWLISYTPDATIEMRKLFLPLLAGLGFGLFYVLIDRIDDGSVYWPLVVSRSTGLLFFVICATITRQAFLPPRQQMGIAALAGTFDTLANAFYAFAAHSGRLDVAAITSSLYPAMTVWLAWLLLKEQLTRSQLSGVLAALIAIGLIVV